MARRVSVPNPPELTNRGVPSEFTDVEAVGGAADLRRAELEGILTGGAWQEAFDEWVEYTDLTPAEIDGLRRLGVFERFDVYWDPDAGALDYEVPTVPDDWTDRMADELNDTPADPTTISNALDDLGRIVVTTIEEAYLQFEDEAPDHVWGVETFGQAPE